MGWREMAVGNGGAAVVRKEGNGRRRGRERRQGQRWAGVSQMGGGHRRHEDRFGMGRIRDVRESVLRESGSRKPDPDNTIQCNQKAPWTFLFQLMLKLQLFNVSSSCFFCSCPCTLCLCFAFQLLMLMRKSSWGILVV